MIKTFEETNDTCDCTFQNEYMALCRAFDQYAWSSEFKQNILYENFFFQSEKSKTKKMEKKTRYAFHMEERAHGSSAMDTCKSHSKRQNIQLMHGNNEFVTYIIQKDGQCDNSKSLRKRYTLIMKL